MKTIAYLLYGDALPCHLELTYSVLTAAHHLNTDPAGIRMVLVTDEANRRADLPLDHLVFGSADFARWIGDGAYGPKLHALLAVLDRYNGAAALVDTNTYFLAHPEHMFARIGARETLMHADEGSQSWRPVHSEPDHPIHDYSVSAESPLSGVIGVDHSLRSALVDALPLMRELRAAYPDVEVEEFVVASVLRKHSRANFCADILRHYRGYERRLMHAQLDETFPRFSAELFFRLVERPPTLGYPPRRNWDLFRAGFKDLLRRQGEGYRFAYLAYRCAFSSKRKRLADEWAQIALDALAAGQFDPKHTRQDFRGFAPDRLSDHGWLSHATRQRWLAYWQGLPA